VIALPAGEICCAKVAAAEAFGGRVGVANPSRFSPFDGLFSILDTPMVDSHLMLSAMQGHS
jgi:hypothetical protein